MICVSISRIDQLIGAIEEGAGLLELRLDLIREDPDLIYSLIPEHVKTIATCRPGDQSEADRITLLSRCMEQGAAYVDVEIETEPESLTYLAAHAKSCGTKIIVSYHNFEFTPPKQELEQLFKQCFERGGDLAKIAVQVNAPEDLHVVLGLFSLPGNKVILGMGEKGRITRLAGPYLGAEFTFGAPGSGSETAPGQFSFKQLTDIYKVIDES